MLTRSGCVGTSHLPEKTGATRHDGSRPRGQRGDAMRRKAARHPRNACHTARGHLSERHSSELDDPYVFQTEQHEADGCRFPIGPRQAQANRAPRDAPRQRPLWNARVRVRRRWHSYRAGFRIYVDEQPALAGDHRVINGLPVRVRRRYRAESAEAGEPLLERAAPRRRLCQSRAVCLAQQRLSEPFPCAARPDWLVPIPTLFVTDIKADWVRLPAESPGLFLNRPTSARIENQRDTRLRSRRWGLA